MEVVREGERDRAIEEREGRRQKENITNSEGKTVILYRQSTYSWSTPEVSLPLALVVIGSLLRNSSRDKWQATFRSLQKSGKGIHELLKISYDALIDDEKEVFLHIACFFKGKNKNDVIDILEGCDLNPEDGIEILKKRALISITEEEDIWMHDLLEDMGKKIVIQESPTEPGERSRLWCYKDVYHVFEENTVSSRETHSIQFTVHNTIVKKIGILNI